MAKSANLQAKTPNILDLKIAIKKIINRNIVMFFCHEMVKHDIV